MLLVQGAIIGAILWALSEAFGPKITLIVCLIMMALLGWALWFFWTTGIFQILACALTGNQNLLERCTQPLN